MSADVPPFDDQAEKATLGAALLLSDGRVVSGLAARGLRPRHFYREAHGNVFTALLSLTERGGGIDYLTVFAEMERLGLRGETDPNFVEGLAGWVPATGNVGPYADRVIELALWRDRRAAAQRQLEAVRSRDEQAWARATMDLERATRGTRTESFSPSQWADLLFGYFSGERKETSELAIPLPWPRLTEALGDGLWRGEVLVIAGPTNMGKSIVADQCLDHAADRGKRCHLYMTEMTALARGMRMLARRTGVPFMRQRRRSALAPEELSLILAELARVPYGCTVAADWSIDDVVRDALRARYDLVVIDLLHGFHYQDERDLDRLSKAIQRLARVSTTLDGHPGTAVIAVAHLKEEGTDRKGVVPRPTLASIKGGSSIKQDADFVLFCWQEQESGTPTGDGELWVAKGRSGELVRTKVRLNPRRFRFEVRDEEGVSRDAASVDPAPPNSEIPF